MSLFYSLLRRLGRYRRVRIGGDARLWSGRWPGVQVDLELRNLWRGHAWINRSEHRLTFGWGDGYSNEALTVWIRYWPVSKAKAEEIPF